MQKHKLNKLQYNPNIPEDVWKASSDRKKVEEDKETDVSLGIPTSKNREMKLERQPRCL